MNTFTASEVREKEDIQRTAARLCQAASDDSGARMWDQSADMLHAYADRLEADERARRVAWLEIPPGEQGDPYYPGYRFHSLTSLPFGRYDLFIRPVPASSDAERLAEALRSIRASLVSVLCDPSGRVVIHGSDYDREVIAKALQKMGVLVAHSTQAQPPAARVTDEMVERARSAFVQADDGSTGITDAIRAALLAAHLAYPQPSRDAKDAARYRWLRDSADSYTWDYLGGIGADRVDAAVDAAMAKESGQ